MTFTHIGSFKVLAALGQGARSNVMLVRRNADELQYALKVVSVAKLKERKYLAQARQEYRVGRMFDHPNLVKVFSIETETDWLFHPKRVKLLIEYVPGQTLDRIPSPLFSDLLDAFLGAAEGVATMHESGVVHADLKPNNIMISPSSVKVIDFGLARVDGEPTDRLQGTPEYMAPETVARKIVDVRTDIYNFGATMYRLTTGLFCPRSICGLPISERTYRERYRKVCDVDPRYPEDFGHLVDRCLCFQPHERPDSMRELCTKLKQFLPQRSDRNSASPPTVDESVR